MYAKAPFSLRIATSAHEGLSDSVIDIELVNDILGHDIQQSI